MRLSIKTKQVLAVTSIVGAVVVALSALHLSALARLSLEESQARGELLARAIYQRTQAVVARATDPYAALRQDAGLRAILESSLYSKNVMYAAVVDPSGTIVAHLDPTRLGQPLESRGRIDDMLANGGVGQLLEIFVDQGRTVEVVEPLQVLDAVTGREREFGAIRVGISTLLVRDELEKALKPALGTALVALLVATAVAMLLAQLLLRPIQVLRASLTRLQQGESGVKVELPKDEFGDLGSFFNAVTEKLSADRDQLVGQKASLESVVDRLEDAVGVFNPQGELLVANPALRALLPESGAGPVTLPPGHPWRELVHTTLATRLSRGPASTGPIEPGGGEWLLMAHPIVDVGQRLIGVMLIARNLATLSQVQHTLNYSRKLTALGRLSAGVAHEVKNPLNAMMIHLELLRQKLSRARTGVGARAAGPISIATATVEPVPIDATAALDHVDVIQNEIRRLDQVLQGFLKFSRPEDLRLQPVSPAELLREVAEVVEAEAQKTRVRLQVDCSSRVPDINGDPGMLRQALLNLALNACQAMPAGGQLSFRCRPSRGRVEVQVADTGVGIAPEHLGRIFDLYFTTRESGSGIGLSMVYRTVQLHDGDIEVQSTPGKGTTFTLRLPAA